MRLSTVHLTEGGTSAAVLDSGVWIHLPFRDVGGLLQVRGWREVVRDVLAQNRAGIPVTLETDAEIAPVVSSPNKILCCGHNYREHIAEMGRPQPEYPTLFAKFADTLTGAFDSIELPESATQLDWEAELAVVVGSPLYQASVDESAAAIAGYTVANDYSVRSWQRRTPQWLQGKAFDATTPLGPVLVTTDEFDPATGATITCRVNGSEQQRGTTDDLLFDPATLLSYISSFTRLCPGDVVLTGTPGGVGAGATPPRFLADGDIVETEIEGIGLQRNRIQIGAVDLSATVY
ncbi:fumarylacetoacetate hydrolase family protein [Rhodococcus sp. NPDC055024]